MDKSTRKNIFLGLFVITGATLFIIGIFLVGSKNETFNKTFAITAKFTNATGLKPGSNIRFNGVKVGIVKYVSLIGDSAVLVGMQIEEGKRTYITNHAVASIASDGLMGDKIVNITTADNMGTTIKDNEEIKAKNPIVTDQLMQTLSTTNENVKVISENLKKLTTDLNTENGTIQELYKDPGMATNLKASFANLNTTTKEVLSVSTALHEVTQQIQHGNGTIGEVLNDTAMANNLVSTMKKLKETSNELNTVSGQLSRTMQQVNSGKGAVNMLLTDSSFSVNMQQSMHNIKSASEKMDEDMEALKHNFLTKRYFKKQAKKHSKTNEPG